MKQGKGKERQRKLGWRQWAGVLVLAGLGAAQAEDRALIVGVGTYQDGSQLLGGHQDIKHMQDIVGRLNFKPGQVKVLTDQQATRQGILSGIQDWLVRGVNPGDRVLFYFVGHGTRFKDASGAQGCSTALVPYDLSNLVTEKDLQGALDRVPAKELLVMLDSCFSGTAYRAKNSKLQPRFMARSEAMACNVPLNMTGEDNRKTLVVGVKSGSAPSTRAITMTAAANNEVAFGYAQGGLFTLSLHKRLVDMKGPVTFADLREFSAQYVRELFSQLDAGGFLPPTPQLFGDPKLLQKDVFTFGHLTSPQTPSIPSPDLQAVQSGQEFLDRFLNTSAFKVEVKSSKGSYANGEAIGYSVTSSADGYLNLFELDSTGALTLLYPNRYQQDNRVQAGKTLTFPGQGAPFQLVAGDPFGRSQVVALVSDTPLDFLNLAGNKQDDFQLFLNVQDLQRLAQGARASHVLPVATGASHGAGSVIINVQP